MSLQYATGCASTGSKPGTGLHVTELPTLHTLDELAELVQSGRSLYVRWSRGPEVDTDAESSTDQLTGVPMPGLSANPLMVEDWWEGRPLRTWVARRLYDYRHLRERRDGDVRPWVLEGREVSRGPDNEPLVECREPVAWLDESVVQEAVREIDEQPAEWGPLDRN